MHLDFTDIAKARTALQSELVARLREQNYLSDARVKLAVASLTRQEITLLSELADHPEGAVRGWNATGLFAGVHEAAIMRLIDKRLITLSGMFKEERIPAYGATQLGRVVAGIAKSGLTNYENKLANEPPKA